MKYLKYFKTESEYNTFVQSEDFILPNVSYAVDADSVFYHIVKAETGDYKIFLSEKKNISGLTYKTVDLGLPSGLLWADRNVGAASSEDAGLYFAWGDTVGYTSEQVINGEKAFSEDWSNYFDTTDGGDTFNKYAEDKLTVLEASDDAASVNMGSDWRMPTQAEMQELIDNTTLTFIDLQGNEFSQSEADADAIAQNNFKGIRFTGTNGNSIFIPASGFCYDSYFLSDGNDGYGLWASGLNSDGSWDAWYLYFDC